MKNMLLVVLIAFLAGLAGAWVLSTMGHAGNQPMISSPVTKETTFERVMRTQTIRCGYIVWPPWLVKDPNSGQMSGITYDYMAALGDALHLKVEWAEEVGMGDFMVGLATGRIDAMCLIWSAAKRAREVDFTAPLFYNALYAYARVDDSRFDMALEKINDPKVTVATIDGEMSGIIAASDFPNAKTFQLQQSASSAERFIAVATKKADVVLTDPSNFSGFNANNPGKMRRVQAAYPVRVLASSLAIAQGQDKFRQMLNTAISELHDSGKIDKILTKHGQSGDVVLRVAAPYQNDKAGQ